MELEVIDYLNLALRWDTHLKFLIIITMEINVHVSYNTEVSTKTNESRWHFNDKII